ncbi:MAG TPA: sigma-54 dependent transcriptional regulator, partial [Acidiferrobacteraceae bacterium]|nr:sigma-54 dependent transcriptional regulator [Acidiferrobacteraceae bacterium]
MSRNLLVYRRRGGREGFCEVAEAAHWSVHLASTVREVETLLDLRDFRVGLVRFDGTDDTELAEVESLIQASTHVSWIAILDPAVLPNPRVSRLVGEAFYDYHTLPVDPHRLLSVVGHAYGMALLKTSSVSLDEAQSAAEPEMVGASATMQKLFRDIRKLAKIDAPIFISGESGTGKELAAQAIHERSSYATGPFIAVNCGALPPNLVQSELFGHEKGAFTGAFQRKIGRLEAASNGTIFLDEIGDLPLDQQVNLLRFLQEKTVQRVGGTEAIPINVRVLAATHVDLEQAVKQGRFREDLYYRLHVLYIKIPPLRERQGDVELLARYFFDKFSRDKSRAVKGFSQQALQVMNNYEWPGNVRELINRVRRAMVMCENRMIKAADLGLDRRNGRRQVVSLNEARMVAEK